MGRLVSLRQSPEHGAKDRLTLTDVNMCETPY
jgi:hypothetical protein